MPRISMRNAQSQRTQPNYKEQDVPDVEKEQLLEKAASQLALYVLHNMDNKKILRRTILQKYCAVKGVIWSKQFTAANIRLKGIYGCELVVCDDTSVKIPSYYVRKTTPHIHLSEHNEEEKRKQNVTFLLMTIVFMSNGKCSLKHLLELFAKLLIIEEEDDQGYVKEVLKELYGNQMLVVQNDVISWGPLADDMVDKTAILEFVSKVYHTSVESWGELHANAVEQLELNRMDEEPENNEANGGDVNMEEPGPSQRTNKYNSQRSRK